MINIGKNIADARKRRGMTQEELADLVGYKTKSAINKIELGIRDLPQKKIAAFAKALGVSPGVLMGWDKEMPDNLQGMGALAAEVLLDPATMQMVQDYISLEEAEKAMVRALVASLARGQKNG